MVVCRGHGYPAARSAVDKPELQEIRLIDVLERHCFFTYYGGKRFKSDGTARKFCYYRFKHTPVYGVEPELVDLEAVKRIARCVAAYA